SRDCRDHKSRFGGERIANSDRWIARIDNLRPLERTGWRIAARTVKRDRNSSERRGRGGREFRPGERGDRAGHAGQRRQRVIREWSQLSHHLVGEKRKWLLSQLDLGAIENVAYHRQLAHAVIQIENVGKVGFG